LNIGTGKGFSIRELVEIIKKEVGYKGRIVFDSSRPEGVAMKRLDTVRIDNLGWRYKVSLEDGIKQTYASFLKELKDKEVRTSKIGKVAQSEKDTDVFAAVKSHESEIINKTQPDSYKGRVVLKPWGYEHLVFENESVAVWLLHIKEGHSTSMHCHPQKKTSLVVLTGSAMSNTVRNRRCLKGGDAIVVEKGVFHSTKALSKNGVYLLEIETPPNKTDIMRLEDRYGREKDGYEGLTEMQTDNLEEYNYFFFEESESYKNEKYENDKFCVAFEVFNGKEEFKRYFKPSSSGLLTCCGGRILNKQNHVALDTGDTQKADLFFSSKDFFVADRTVLLRTSTKDK
jgi:mannose-6-phosphate isomerase-like protein (cupin superfamily)